MTLKEMIVEYRESHSLSQRKFAQMCGLSNSYISMIEKEMNPSTGEKITPTLSALKCIADGMGITVDRLLRECDDMPVDISVEHNYIAVEYTPEDEALRTSLQKLKDRPELRTLLDAADGISAEDVEDFAKWLMKMRGVD